MSTAAMDIEDDDDIYAPEEPAAPPAKTEADAKADTQTAPANGSRKEEELEEGEEEDEGGEVMDEDDDDDSVRLFHDRWRQMVAPLLARGLLDE